MPKFMSESEDEDFMVDEGQEDEAFLSSDDDVVEVKQKPTRSSKGAASSKTPVQSTKQAPAGRPSNPRRSSAATQRRASTSLDQQTVASDMSDGPDLPSARCQNDETQPSCVSLTGAADTALREQAPSPGHEEIDEDVVDEEAQAIREANIKAMLSNNVKTERTAVMPKFLMIREGEKQLKKPFSSPSEGQPAESADLKRRLAMRRKFVPWGGGAFNPLSFQSTVPEEPEAGEDDTTGTEDANAALEKAKAAQAAEVDENPLILWRPGEGQEGPEVRVAPMLTKCLRDHQREGLQFLFDCVTGQKTENGQGCILADDMGLGKTLQGVALLWVILSSGTPALGGNPIGKRAMIVCPTSLVSNWEGELAKWLHNKARVLALVDASRDAAIAAIESYLSKRTVHDVLVISYETFRLQVDLFNKPNAAPVDLLICDEAHRLKNNETKTTKALDSLSCRRRVLLSGTPMQNHLDEFFAMVNFCNPGVLGTPSEFRKHYESPILASREPDATPEQLAKGEARSQELSGIVNAFILRRTNTLLSKFQPPKLVEVVCCKMTQLQRDLYNHFLESKATARLMKAVEGGAASKGGTKVLGAITALKKLCNHPKLIYDVVNGKNEKAKVDGFKGCEKFFLPGVFDDGRVGRGQPAEGWEALSGKFAFVADMLHVLWTRTRDKIVIVSNYTQTLDLMTTLCRARNYPCVRLDGSTTIKNRQKMVETYCQDKIPSFVFLLSSKAGGCGLNLIGANRLILFDPDWNPATDKQAAARVWRNGQRKHVYVYRLLATGTLEEKVFQRQLSKEGLSNVVNQSGKSAQSDMSTEDLADLFTPDYDCLSSTYEGMLEAAAGGEGAEELSEERLRAAVHRAQTGQPSEDEVKDWGWHSSRDTVDDDVLREIGADTVSFVFSLHVPGCEVQESSGLASGPRGAGGAAAGGCAAMRGTGRRALSAAGASGGARAPLGGGGKPLSANPMGASLVRRPLPPSRPGGARFSAPAAAAAGKENTAGTQQPSSANGTGPTSVLNHQNNKRRLSAPLVGQSAPAAKRSAPVATDG